MRRFCALLLFPLFLTAPAHATTVLKVGIPDLTRTSEWIVRADVVDVQVVDLTHRNEGVWTDVTLSVRQVWKGADVPSTTTIRLLGGTARSGRTLKVPGMPTFAVGEDVLLFLERTAIGHIPTGLGQGVWRVLTTPSGDEWARQSTGEVRLVRYDHLGRIRPAPPAAETRPLDELFEQVVLP